MVFEYKNARWFLKRPLNRKHPLDTCELGVAITIHLRFQKEKPVPQLMNSLKSKRKPQNYAVDL